MQSAEKRKPETSGREVAVPPPQGKLKKTPEKAQQNGREQEEEQNYHKPIALGGARRRRFNEGSHEPYQRQHSNESDRNSY